MTSTKAPKGNAKKPAGKAKSTKPKTNGKRGPTVIAKGTSIREAKRQTKAAVDYSADIAKKICEMVAIRVPMKKICSQPGFPSERTIYRWKLNHPEFVEQLELARMHRAEARADKIDEVIEDLRNGKLDPHTARVIFDAERWQASKENARFGDKISTEISGKDGSAIKIETHEDKISMARWIALQLREGLAAANERNKENGAIRDHENWRFMLGHDGSRTDQGQP